MDTNQDVVFTSNSSPCNNDDARSAILWNMKKDQVIRIFDDSNGTATNPKDDFMYIVIKRDFNKKIINTFETSFYDQDVIAIYGTGGNLDGKVSRFTSYNN